MAPDENTSVRAGFCPAAIPALPAVAAVAIAFFFTSTNVSATGVQGVVQPFTQETILIAGTLVVLLQAALIVSLALSVRRRRKAESDLRSEQVLTRAVFDSVPGLLYLYTMEGRLVRWNKKHEELTGYSAEELARMTVQDWFYPEDLASVRKVWDKVFTDGDAMMEFHLKHKDSSRVPYFATGVSMEIAGKLYLVGIAIDITDHKNLQEDAKRQLLELAHVSRVAMMGEFSASVAHELNQPLGAILRHAEAGEMLLENGKPDLMEIRSILTAIRLDDQRAADVIHRLRALLERRTIQTAAVDISVIVADSLAVARHEAIKRRINVTTDVHANLPPVIGERVHLQQVLLNLLTNAMDAVQELAPGQRDVSISASRTSHGMLELTVSDRGAGIESNELAKIFDSFYTTKPSGLGMGLSISRSIVEAHGGRIRASSTPGEGTKVSFTLPASEP